MGKSQISWTDSVWNPIVGCTKTSEGCRECYAIKMTWRLAHNPKVGLTYQGLVEKDIPNGNLDWTGTVRHLDSRINEPAKWRKPSRVFVCSQADLFHDDVPGRFINLVWNTIYNNPQHTYIILTKRPARLLRWTETAAKAKSWPISEIWPDWAWLGVTAESQPRADERIPLLLQVPAKTHWVSVEPMLGPVDLTGLMAVGSRCRIERIDWCVIGAEHAKHARPTQLNWIRSLVQQCNSAGTKVFVKQARIDGKLVKMPVIDGKVWNEYPNQEVA